jgi:type I restriction enzyme R subunit
MYVDKRLSGVQAVQTLSRLNRTHPGKDDTIVLDFVNDAEEIQQSFQPYYEATSIQEKADPQQLYDLQHKLYETGVFLRSEVDTFARAFYGSSSTLSTRALAQMNGALDPAVQRFKQLNETEQEEFRHDLTAYRNLFSFLSQVLPYPDPALEKLYGFARFLLTKLPKRDSGSPVELGEDIALEYYRLQKVSEGAVSLEAGKGGMVSGPVAVGTGVVKEEAVPLSTLIGQLNERFGTEFTPADQLFFDQVIEEAKQDEGLMQAAKANTEENFRYPFERVLQDLFIDRMEQNQDIFTRFMNEPAFQEAVTRLMLQQVYGQLRAAP